MSKIQLPSWEVIPLKSPEEQMKIFMESGQIPKLTRKRKYATEEEAKAAARLLKQRNRAKDQQKLRDFKYNATDAQLYLIRRLQRIAIRDTDVIASMHKEIDKFDEQAVKIKGLLEITDTKQAVQQKQEFTEE